MREKRTPSPVQQTSAISAAAALTVQPGKDPPLGSRKAHPIAKLGVRFSLTYAHVGSAASAAVIMLRYFTIIANLLVAVEMTRLALGARISPFTLGGLTIAMILVGVVYGILLRNIHPLTGAALFASDLMHDVSPVATALYWMFLVPHGRLRWSAPALRSISSRRPWRATRAAGMPSRR